MRGKHVFALASMWLALFGLFACAAPEEEAADPGAELWVYLETTQPKLYAMRDELAAKRARLEALEEGTDPAADSEAAAEGEGEGETPPTPEELRAEIEELQSEARALADEFYAKLAEYLNSQGIVEGEELTPNQRQAFDWKAQEDILLAQEYIVQGGDYKRAIDIYEQSLLADPGNEALLAAKEEAERLRYMDEERFAQVKKGMTQKEVRALLGTTKSSNQREFPEKNMVGWFYPKEDRGAAGVYFEEKRRGEGDWVVSVFDFEAVKPPETQVIDSDEESQGG